jgi:uncharacterized protein (DUF433 family)/transposase
MCHPRAVKVAELLDRPTYLYAEVDRLIGLPAGTARRWINGYERGGKHYEPILRSSAHATDWVTWGEFVEARMLAEFRDQSVPTTRLRAAVERLREMFDVAYPLAHLRPYLAADQGELAIDSAGLDSSDDGMLVIRTGQLILASGRSVMETATLASDGQGEKFAAEIQPDHEYPGIKINPDRLSGQPTFEGRRVSVATIAGMVASGDPRDELAADYGLSLAQIDSAVRYVRKHRLLAA